MHGFETRIIVLVGLPGSGKSTLARNFMSYLNASHSSLNVQLIEYDTITKSLSQKNNNDHSWLDDLQAWKETRLFALDLLKNHFIEMNQRSEEKDLHMIPKSMVIMDDNFHLRSMRRDVYQLCQEYLSSSEGSDATIGLTFVHVEATLKECLYNNKKREGSDQFISEETILKISYHLEPPNPSKAMFEKVTLRTSSYQKEGKLELSQSIYKDMDDLSLESIRLYKIHPLRPKNLEELEKERNVTRNSKLHQMDLILRRLVRESCKEDKSLAKLANEVRKDIIAYCKNELADFPPTDEDSLECWVAIKYQQYLMEARMNSDQHS